MAQLGAWHFQLAGLGVCVVVRGRGRVLFWLWSWTRVVASFVSFGRPRVRLTSAVHASGVYRQTEGGSSYIDQRPTCVHFILLTADYVGHR